MCFCFFLFFLNDAVHIFLIGHCSILFWALDCLFVCPAASLLVYPASPTTTKTNMPEIKLKHVVSCSTEDTVSALVWIYEQCLVELFLRSQKSALLYTINYLLLCKIDSQSRQPAEFRHLPQVEGS